MKQVLYILLLFLLLSSSPILTTHKLSLLCVHSFTVAPSYPTCHHQDHGYRQNQVQNHGGFEISKELQLHEVSCRNLHQHDRLHEGFNFVLWSRRRKSSDEGYNDDGEYYYSNDKEPKTNQDDNYDDDEYDDQDDYEYYSDYDDYDDEEDEDMKLDWEWETYQQTTHVYLPPPISSTTDASTPTTTPKTIVHFIGGTLFGSYPLQFYKPFLEQIAKKSNSIIVATSIPVSFQSNPLNHKMLCWSVTKAFRGAYKNVLCDEYGEKKVREEMKIVGLGHSLGSRLHCIISTDGDEAHDDSGKTDTMVDNKNDNKRSQKKKRGDNLQKIGLKREGNILLSFNNYSAMSSVPGVQTLEKGVRDTRREEKEMRQRIKEQRMRSMRRRKRSKKISRRDSDYDDEYDDEYDYNPSNRKRRNYDYYVEDDDEEYDYFNDDDDELDLKDIFTSIKSSLTPDLKKSSLEFQPTPDELWDKISKVYGKNVGKTLIVQFDDDGIDQSSRLAQEILDSTCSIKKKDEGDVEGDTLVSDESNNDNIFFARLKGTHLNPVTYSDSFGLVQIWKRLSGLPMDALLKEAIDEDEQALKLRTRRKETISTLKRNNLNDLTTSISRYITEIIN